jgi:predicted  nucleic acid-binding Zn-ribbon protein
VSAKRYSDDEYDLLQVQFAQAQKSLQECRNKLSDKEFEITQLQAKMECMKRNEVDVKRRWTEERYEMEQENENAHSRERKLLN